jgi:hypothetical protein
MDTEGDGYFPFLNIDIYGKPEGLLGHMVHGKPARTNFYLYATFQHPHPTRWPCFSFWCIGALVATLASVFRYTVDTSFL